MTAQPPLVLVLCTGNSCRSHMAEGILRAASRGAFAVASAFAVGDSCTPMPAASVPVRRDEVAYDWPPSSTRATSLMRTVAPPVVARLKPAAPASFISFSIVDVFDVASTLYSTPCACADSVWPFTSSPRRLRRLPSPSPLDYP